MFAKVCIKSLTLYTELSWIKAITLSANKRNKRGNVEPKLKRRGCV